MLGQVRYPKAQALQQVLRIGVLVPESDGLYSTWNSGTNILMLSVLVPESDDLYSTWNSGTKLIILKNIYMKNEQLW